MSKQVFIQKTPTVLLAISQAVRAEQLRFTYSAKSLVLNDGVIVKTSLRQTTQVLKTYKQSAKPCGSYRNVVKFKYFHD